MLLDNQCTLVTGAASGIGRAIALAFAREGARVMVADRNIDGARETVGLIEAANGQALACHLDADRPQSHFDAVHAAVSAFGALHIACNNAGISTGPSRTYRPVADITPEDWEQLIGVNLSGVFHGLRAQIPALLAAGGGSVVNIASVMGQVAGPGLGAYVASKHGVVGLTKAAALDYAGRNIRVNAIGPGYIDTPLLGHKDAATLQALAGRHPMGRLGRAGEIAELALWLASDRASFVTGAYYPVDGGYLAQ